MEKVRVGIIGCGRIADLHALGYQGRADAAITAVCDIKPSHARAKAKAWGVVKVYETYEELLADRNIDLVEILTPHHLHAPMVIEACQHGKHVSVQKPMCLIVAEADEMTTAAERTGVLLRVYENFVFYPPAIKARELLEEGAIGKPRMIRMHVSTGASDFGWKVPLDSWVWRFEKNLCGGGPLVFDHGYHLFSLAYDLMGEVERVYAWIDATGVAPGANIDAPAVIMFQFKGMHKYGVLDVEHTPKTVIHSDHYCDDDRVEIIGEKGILFINRYTTRTVDLPALMLFRDGETSVVPVERDDWESSFIAATGHFIDVILRGGEPSLNAKTGKAVLQFALAAQQSARTGQEVCPDDVA